MVHLKRISLTKIIIDSLTAKPFSDKQEKNDRHSTVCMKWNDVRPVPVILSLSTSPHPPPPSGPLTHPQRLWECFFCRVLSLMFRRHHRRRICRPQAGRRPFIIKPWLDSLRRKRERMLCFWHALSVSLLRLFGLKLLCWCLFTFSLQPCISHWHRLRLQTVLLSSRHLVPLLHLISPF